MLQISGSDSGPWFAEVRDLVLAWLPQTEDVLLTGADHSGMTDETYTYDANGNMEIRVENDVTYTQYYDAENRLISATSAGTTATLARHAGELRERGIAHREPRVVAIRDIPLEARLGPLAGREQALQVCADCV